MRNHHAGGGRRTYQEEVPEVTGLSKDHRGRRRANILGCVCILMEQGFTCTHMSMHAETIGQSLPQPLYF